MIKRKLCECVLLVTLGLAAQSLPRASAQDRPALTPFIGETTAEFEARKKGLPRPVTANEASSVMLVADARGHFGVEPLINGARVRMVVDTGASSVALTEEDARAAGINPPSRDFTVKMATANGIVLVAPVLLRDVVIGDIVVRDVHAVVVPEDKLQVSLLGMSFLSKLSRFEASGGRLILRR